MCVCVDVLLLQATSMLITINAESAVVCVATYCFQIIGRPKCVWPRTNSLSYTMRTHHFVDEHLMQFESEPHRVLLCSREPEAEDCHHAGRLPGVSIAPPKISFWKDGGKVRFSCTRRERSTQKTKKKGVGHPTAGGNKRTSH